mmetsp:Transcript_55527/g.129233  ORF Transcript_55527/g.129233 Transcript_55527/m.129233 type:complete len:214 (+) Transcript_55527:846-1487(+)
MPLPRAAGCGKINAQLCASLAVMCATLTCPGGSPRASLGPCQRGCNTDSCRWITPGTWHHSWAPEHSARRARSSMWCSCAKAFASVMTPPRLRLRGRRRCMCPAARRALSVASTSWSHGFTRAALRTARVPSSYSGVLSGGSGPCLTLQEVLGLMCAGMWATPHWPAARGLYGMEPTTSPMRPLLVTSCTQAYLRGKSHHRSACAVVVSLEMQ